MLTAKTLAEALDGLDPDAQVIVGIMNGPEYIPAYAEQRIFALADVDTEQRVTLRSDTALALYICCYEEPRPWDGEPPTLNEDGTATFRYEPEPKDDQP